MQFGGLPFNRQIKPANISYLYIYVWKSLTKLPNLIFLLSTDCLIVPGLGHTYLMYCCSDIHIISQVLVGQENDKSMSNINNTNGSTVTSAVSPSCGIMHIDSLVDS